MISTYKVFGFKAQANDYKVVTIEFPYKTEDAKPPHIEVYSLSQDSL